MKRSNLSAVVAKLQDAEKSFVTTFAGVEKQWTDVARREFEEDYLDTIRPHLKQLIESVSRLAAELASAESQCNPENE